MNQTPCRLWDGVPNADGYGYEHGQAVHRTAYEAVHGPIPEGLVIDHLCRVRNCQEVSHLEAVTSRENTLRGQSPPAINARKTACPRCGSAYVPSFYNRRLCPTCRPNCGRCGKQKTPYGTQAKTVCYPCNNRFSRNKKEQV